MYVSQSIMAKEHQPGKHADDCVCMCVQMYVCGTRSMSVSVRVPLSMCVSVLVSALALANGLWAVSLVGDLPTGPSGQDGPGAPGGAPAVHRQKNKQG